MTKKRILRFETGRAAAAYCATHHFAEHAEDTTEATIRFVKQPKRAIAIRLDPGHEAVSLGTRYKTGVTMMRRAGMGGMIVTLLLVTPGTGWTQIPPWQLYERPQEHRLQPAEPERPREEMKTQRQREESRQVEDGQPQRLEERQKDERLQERQP